VTSGKVAKALGVYPSTIRKWVANGTIPEPRRDQAGRMVWEDGDIKRLKKRLRSRLRRLSRRKDKD